MLSTSPMRNSDLNLRNSIRWISDHLALKKLILKDEAFYLFFMQVETSIKELYDELNENIHSQAKTVASK